MDQIHICVGKVIGSTPPPHTRGWGGAVAAAKSCKPANLQTRRPAVHELCRPNFFFRPRHAQAKTQDHSQLWGDRRNPSANLEQQITKSLNQRLLYQFLLYDQKFNLEKRKSSVWVSCSQTRSAQSSMWASASAKQREQLRSDAPTCRAQEESFWWVNG